MYSPMITKKIPQTDPLSSYRAYQSEINEAIQQVLESGFYVLGEPVEAFEQEFSSYLGTNYGIGVASEIGRAHV